MKLNLKEKLSTTFNTLRRRNGNGAADRAQTAAIFGTAGVGVLASGLALGIAALPGLGVVFLGLAVGKACTAHIESKKFRNKL